MVVHRITMPDPLWTPPTCRCWRTFFFVDSKKTWIIRKKRHEYTEPAWWDWWVFRRVSVWSFHHSQWFPPVICADACLLMCHTEVEELIGCGSLYKDTTWRTHTFIPTHFLFDFQFWNTSSFHVNKPRTLTEITGFVHVLRVSVLHFDMIRLGQTIKHTQTIS